MTDPPQKKLRESMIGNKIRNIFIPAVKSFIKKPKEYFSEYILSKDGQNSSRLINSRLFDSFLLNFMPTQQYIRSLFIYFMDKRLIIRLLEKFFSPPLGLTKI
jgi:hypothetical protein